jgi:putative peptidoglycan lipid II flippase
MMVAAGILFSRIAGLIRERVFAYYLGNSIAAGAFRAALRIPNLLQNLFGEGVLSASFIPVYAKMLAEGKEDEARKVATHTLSLLFLIVSVIVALGMTFSREMTTLLAPGFEGETRDFTVQLVVIMFPGTALLVLSAWCLGILNTHRRFFLSYVAPVIWNITIITALVVGGRYYFTSDVERFVQWIAWSTVVGAGLQFLVQLPSALRLNSGLPRPDSFFSGPIRKVAHNFFPALLARGVVQLSAYIDQVLASFLGAQAVSAMAYAQTIYLLPVSLFGMSISSAELPEMSRSIGTPEEVAARLRQRLAKGLVRISFFIIPSVVAFILLGDVVVATLFQNGKFQSSDSRFVWWILAGSTVGLLATTQSRLYVSAFYALHDTKTPARFALIRVLLTGGLGYLVTFPCRQRFGWEVAYSSAGLTASAGIAGWLEFLMIKASLTKRIGPVKVGLVYWTKYWGAALGAGAAAFGVKRVLPLGGPLVKGLLILGVFGVLYFVLAKAFGGAETEEILGPLLRRLPGRKSQVKRP